MMPVLPLVIFFAELAVVTLSTMRIIFVSRGMKTMASALGFFEITIWLFAIGQIMRNLTDVGCYLGFAAGFTCGNYLGVIIEKKLAIGTLVVRIITHRDATGLVRGLQRANYGVTSLDAHGATGPVKVIFTVIQRIELSKVVAIIQGFSPTAFYSVEEIQSAEAGIFPAGSSRLNGVVPRVLRPVLRVGLGSRVAPDCSPDLQSARAV